MGGLDPAKLLMILVLALVVLGPERLPKAARQIGAFWRDFNLFRERLEQEVRSAIPGVDLPPIPKMPVRGLTGYLTGMMQETDRSSPRPADQGPEDEGVVEDEALPADGEASLPAGASSARRAQWQTSGASLMGARSTGNPAPVVVPNGVPASWGSVAAESPGFASGSFLSSVPAASPEALLGAEALFDLDDPSWN